MIGPYRIVDTRESVIVPRKDFPFIERAHKLARCISPNELEELLAGKRHLHLNPRKKAKVPNIPFPAGTPVDLSGLKVIGKLNIDDPKDPMNREVI